MFEIWFVQRISKIRILHIIPDLGPGQGGPAKACIDMAVAVAARGHTVDIFTTDYAGPGTRQNVPTDRPVRQGSVNIHYFYSQTLRIWHGVSYGLWQAIRHRLDSYDIVHMHSMYLFDSLVAGYYCRKHGVPYLTRTAGTLDPYFFYRHRWRKAVVELLFERRNLKNAAAVHFTAQDEMERARALMPFGRGIVVPLGLHLEDYKTLPISGTFRAAFPEVGDKKLILFLGRLNFVKGLDLLIPSFAQIAHERQDVHLVLAGPDSGGYGNKVRSWANDHKISDRVTFTGMLQGQMKLAAFRDAAIFVLPSYSENFGIATVEAMACGLPVAISNKIKIWREIELAGAGLVGDCDVPSVTRQMRQLLEAPDKSAQMGRQARALVEKLYDWKKVAVGLETVYSELLAG